MYRRRYTNINRYISAANRVGGGLSAPASHTTVRTVPYTAVQQGLTSRRRVGLIDAIDRRLNLLKVHLPYHESDHVLNIAYNILCGGDCLEDLELRRNDEVYLDALGAQRIPDPTTEGDFCRRFDAPVVEILQDTLNDVRLRVWREQSAEFFERATIDVDGVLAETNGECKQGIGLAYDGTWGYPRSNIVCRNKRR